MIKKEFFLLSVTILIVGLLAACGGGGPVDTSDGNESETKTGNVSGDSDGETKEILLSSAVGTGGVEEVANESFKKYLEEMSSDRFEVHIYYGGTLGADAEIAEQVSLGEVHMQYGGVSELEMFLGAGSWPLNIPFLFDDRNSAQELIDEVLLDDFNEQLEEHNVQILDAVLRSPRKLTANKPITHPDEVQGLKIRVPEITEWVTTWDSILGASSVAMGGSEVFSAMQTGIIDAQENPVSFIYSNNIYEVNPYIMNTDHVLAPRIIYASKGWLDSLTEEEQGWVTEAAEQAYGEQFDNELEFEKTLSEELTEQGVEFIDVDYAAFQQVVIENVEDEFRNLYSDEVWEGYIKPRLEEIRSGM